MPREQWVPSGELVAGRNVENNPAELLQRHVGLLLREQTIAYPQLEEFGIFTGLDGAGEDGPYQFDLRIIPGPTGVESVVTNCINNGERVVHTLTFPQDRPIQVSTDVLDTNDILYRVYPDYDAFPELIKDVHEGCWQARRELVLPRLDRIQTIVGEMSLRYNAEQFEHNGLSYWYYPDKFPSAEIEIPNIGVLNTDYWDLDPDNPLLAQIESQLVYDTR